LRWGTTAGTSIDGGNIEYVSFELSCSALLQTISPFIYKLQFCFPNFSFQIGPSYLMETYIIHFKNFFSVDNQLLSDTNAFTVNHQMNNMASRIAAITAQQQQLNTQIQTTGASQVAQQQQTQPQAQQQQMQQPQVQQQQQQSQQQPQQQQQTQLPMTNQAVQQPMLQAQQQQQLAAGQANRLNINPRANLTPQQRAQLAQAQLAQAQALAYARAQLQAQAQLRQANANAGAANNNSNAAIDNATNDGSQQQVATPQMQNMATVSAGMSPTSIAQVGQPNINAGSPLALPNGTIPSPSTQFNMQAMAANAQNLRPLAGQAGQQITAAKIQQLFQSGHIPRSAAQNYISQLAARGLQQQQPGQPTPQQQQQQQPQPQQQQQQALQQQQQQQHNMAAPQQNAIQFQNNLQQAAAGQTSEYRLYLNVRYS
jgi:hypothetical protein